MLVSGLKNEALSTMISDSNGDYSCVYQSLCDCARTMLDKYRQKQATSENGHKLRVKIRAVTILLQELSKVPKDACATREALSSALERHAEELQGYEHLLSVKGNIYEIIKQTQELRAHGFTPASLLQYHKLKNKFLGPDSPLRNEQKKVISALDEKKGLTLEILEMLSAHTETTASIMAKLYYKAGVLDQDLFTKVLKHEKPDEAADAILGLSQHKLDTEDNYSVVLKHKKPLDVARGIWELHSCQLLTDKNLDNILMQENPFITAMAMTKLNQAGLLDKDVCAGVFKHKNQFGAAMVILGLKKAGLLTQDLCARVLEHEKCGSAFLVITYLHHCGLLTDKHLDHVFKHEHFSPIANIFFILGESLRTQGNLYAVISHPDVATLNSEIVDYLSERTIPPGEFEQPYHGISGARLAVLDQKGFETCLAKTGYIKKT